MAKSKRRILAIGDLHGDYYRLVRYLKENFIVDDNLRVNKDLNNTYVILVGDYIDWRGEDLEGDIQDWHLGSKRILDLLIDLKKQFLTIKKENANFNSSIITLLGNHDKMMLDSFRILVNTPDVVRHAFFENMGEIPVLLKSLNSMNIGHQLTMDLLSVYNWYMQGGETTIESFGSVDKWMEAMESKEYQELYKDFRLAFIIDRILFAHSIPDHEKYWLALDEINKLSDKQYLEIEEQFLWGRRVWGINAFTGTRVGRFTEDEVKLMLARFDVDKCVIGHTPLFRDEPSYEYDGRIINIDTHGISGSKPLILEYEVQE